MPRYAKQGENLLYQKKSKNGLKSRKYSKYKEFLRYDKDTIYLPRQDANKTLKYPKNQGFGIDVQEIYPHFTTFDNHEM